MKRIHQLSKNVINQIAAGEVIERPASVVKELVENSIDAGATKGSSEISNECRDIRVADNGSGIHPNIVLAFSKHATSKISSGEDLYNIHTLGFRGEALASIISIAKVTCITRTKDYDYGTKVQCENSEIEYSQTGCAIGTIMQISDLFYNLPVRLKFLKSEKTEFAYISELVTAIALSNPKVSIELKNNGKTTIKTDGISGIEGVIKNIFSKEVFSNLKKIQNEDKLSKIEISGYISTPDYTRSSKKDYHIFVNGRTVKCPVFIKAIDMAYKTLIPNGKYPFVVLYLNLPSEDIDVNVHPTKREVKYKNTNQIFNFIRTSIGAGVNEGVNVVGVNDRINVTDDRKVVSIERFNVFQQEDEDEYTPRVPFDESNLLKNLSELKSSAAQKKPYVSAENHEQKTFIKEDIKPREKIIGQYKDTYILIEKEDGLEIVDQHIADERYIYEKLKSTHNTASQLLFVSDVLEVDLKDAEIIKENLSKFEKYGYEIEFLAENEIIFRKLPQMISKYAPREILNDILENIEGEIDNLEEKILIMTSCKSAVKANTPLNLFQMEEIITRWRNCPNNYTCPHGRPISKLLKHNEIAGFFMRDK